MDEDVLIERLAELVNDFIVYYDKLSESDQDKYLEICSIVNKLQGG